MRRNIREGDCDLEHQDCIPPHREVFTVVSLGNSIQRENSCIKTTVKENNIISRKKVIDPVPPNEQREEILFQVIGDVFRR